MKTLFALATAGAVAGLALAGSASRADHQTAKDIRYFAAPAVAAAFAKGMPLLEHSNYKIHASRREAPGQAEVHEKDTDIIHVLEGRATLVTGGTIVDGKTVATGEIRGTDVRGGTAYSLVQGDVLVVPAGVPHRFEEVQGPFLYYVVKVQ